MTVQAATRMWSRHDATITVEAGRKYKATIREGYQIVCDATDSLRDVVNAADLPVLNQVYPGSTQIRVVSRNPTQVSPIFYTCEIVYEGSFGPGGISDSPLNERPTVNWGKVDSDEPIDQDLNGNPLVNSNGEPIYGLTKRLSDLTVTVTRNYQTISLPLTYQYLHSVNSDIFLGFAPGVCRMTQFVAPEKFAEEVGGYYEVTAGFEFRWPYNTTAQKAWYQRVKNEGYLVRGGPEIIFPPLRATDKSGQDTTKPVPLNLDGTLNTSGTHVWLEFPIYTPLNYNALGLFS